RSVDRVAGGRPLLPPAFPRPPCSRLGPSRGSGASPLNRTMIFLDRARRIRYPLPIESGSVTLPHVPRAGGAPRPRLTLGRHLAGPEPSDLDPGPKLRVLAVVSRPTKGRRGEIPERRGSTSSW